MSMVELLLIAVGLSMDAFAVAICAGLGMNMTTMKKSLIVGLYFGLFQAIMPIAGYFLAIQFSDKIMAFDHWIAFVLLAIIGGKMILESLEKELDTDAPSVAKEISLRPNSMLPLAVATSIDAMAVGVSFAFLDVEIWSSASYIGVTTLILSMIGVKIGNLFGLRLKSKSELAGGVILVLIGLKILLEHLGVLAF